MFPNSRYIRKDLVRQIDGHAIKSTVELPPRDGASALELPLIIGIVADDLTGAADAVAPFATRGLAADVQWAFVGPQPAAPDSPDARAWSTETRDLPEGQGEAIRERTRAATVRLARLRPEIFYKKIDSTLRGHLRLELDAMRGELPHRLALVCPGFPANGRTVRHGRLCVHDIEGARVQAAFGMERDPSALELDLVGLRALGPDFPAWLEAVRARGTRTLFCDAESDEDLGAIAGAVVAAPDRFLPVGSAGLARAIAGLCPAGAARHGAGAAAALMAGPGLVVVGSRHPVSRRQARVLARAAGIKPLAVGVAGTDEALESEIARRFETGQRIVLAQSPEIHAAGYTASIPFRVDRLAAHITGLGMVLTGGATAMAVLSNGQAYPPMEPEAVAALEEAGAAVARGMQTAGMEIEGELEPGLVVGQLRASDPLSSQWHGLPILVKAGGFGDDDALARCLGLDVDRRRPG